MAIGTPREVNAPRPHLASLAVPLLLIAAAAGLYLPLFDQLGLADHDALANVAQLRADRGGPGWEDGFFLLNVGVLTINGLLNLTGLVIDHYFLAHQILVWLCLAGLAAAFSILVDSHTGRRGFGLALGLVLLTLPGEVRLMRMFEDNLFATFVHLLYLAAYLHLVRAANRPPGVEPAPGRLFLYGIFPLAFFTAILSHRQFVVLWPTVFLLPWFLRAWPAQRRRSVALTALLSGAAGALLVFALLTRLWDQAWTWEGYLGHLKAWVFPEPVYRNFYFFNHDGWTWSKQASDIFVGLSRLFACATALPLAALALWLLMAALLLIRVDWRAAAADPVNRVLLLFIAVHVPHSLIYESYNIERWDAILAPLLLLLARLYSRPRAAAPRLTQPLAAALCLLILIMNLAGYAVLTRELRAADASLAELQPLLMTNVLTDNAPNGERLLLVINEDEYGEHFMLAEAFFDFRDELLIVTSIDAMVRTVHPYPQLIQLDMEETGRLLRTRRIVATRRTTAQLRSLFDLPDGQFFTLPSDRNPATDSGDI
jgi:hypothetical protein